MSELKVCSGVSAAQADVDACVARLEQLLKDVRDNNVTSFAIAMTTADRCMITAYELGNTDSIPTVIGVIEYLKTRFIQETLE